jgi:hypothetical protein
VGGLSHARGALADQAMVTREAPDPRPFLALCDTCGARRPWPTRAQAVADAGQHHQAHRGHRTRVQNQNAILNGMGTRQKILWVLSVIILLALVLLNVVPPLYRFLTSR